MPSPLSIFAAFVFSALVAAAAGADETELWQYQCLGDEETDDRICTTEIATFIDGEEFVVYFVHVSTGKPPLVVAGENENIAEATVAVGKNDPLSSRDCEDGSCFFNPADSASLMKQFRKGFRTKITLKAGDDEVLFNQEISLRGFTTALTAPR